MAYTVYATKADLAEFTGKSVDVLPADTDALLRKASDLITNSMVHNPFPPFLSVDETADRTEALKLATCAQVEYWFEAGSQDVNADRIQSYSAGSVSVTYANNGGAKKPLCNSARAYLNKQGLLYKGIRLSSRDWTERSDEQC